MVLSDSEIAVLLKDAALNPKKRHKLYDKCKDHAENMEVHMYGKTPEKLLQRVRPHEDPAITAYRLDSYEPTTMSTAEKALTVVNKIFHPGNYSIRFENDTNSEKLKKATLVEYPVFNSIATYLSQYALKKVIADPNGIFVVQPYEYGIRDTERVQPILTAYECEDVWLKTPDYVVICLAEKQDEKDAQERVVKTFWIFQWVEANVIVNYKLWTQNNQDYFLDVLSSYVTNFNQLPVWSLGGMYDHDHAGMFQSFFYNAVPFWNKAINAESDLDGAYVKHMNPQKWEMADECEYVFQSVSGQKYGCIGGHIFDVEEGKKFTCPSCQGHGYKSLTGPYETAWVNKEKFTGENQNIPTPPMGYVNVPTEATAMLEKRVDALLKKGLCSLNMDALDSVGENQSGIAKVIDRTELNDFLGKIRDRFFDTHITNFFYFAAKYMFAPNGEDVSAIEPDVIKPQNFDIYNTTELTEQLKVAKEAGLSPSYLQTKEVEIQNKEYQTNPDLLSMLNLISKLDPLAEETREDIMVMQQTGSVTKQNVVIHDNIREFVATALIENKGFSDLGFLEQRKILLKYADVVVKANKVTLEVPPTVDPKGNPV